MPLSNLTNLTSRTFREKVENIFVSFSHQSNCMCNVNEIEKVREPEAVGHWEAHPLGNRSPALACKKGKALWRSWVYGLKKKSQ